MDTNDCIYLCSYIFHHYDFALSRAKIFYLIQSLYKNEILEIFTGSSFWTLK